MASLPEPHAVPFIKAEVPRRSRPRVAGTKYRVRTIPFLRQLKKMIEVRSSPPSAPPRPRPEARPPSAALSRPRARRRILVISQPQDEPAIIKWDSGNIIIPDPKELEKALPAYYRHRNYASFQRQLNNARARRGKTTTSPFLETRAPPTQFGYHRKFLFAVDAQAGTLDTVYHKLGTPMSNDIEDLLALRPVLERTSDKKRDDGADASQPAVAAPVNVVKVEASPTSPLPGRVLALPLRPPPPPLRSLRADPAAAAPVVAEAPTPRAAEASAKNGPAPRAGATDARGIEGRQYAAAGTPPREVVSPRAPKRDRGDSDAPASSFSASKKPRATYRVSPLLYYAPYVAVAAPFRRVAAAAAPRPPRPLAPAAGAPAAARPLRVRVAAAPGLAPPAKCGGGVVVAIGALLSLGSH